MTVDVDLMLKALPILLSLAAMITAVVRTRTDKVDDRFKAGSDRMDGHELRLSRVEQTVEGLPSRQDIHQIQLSIVEMNGHMEKMQAVMEGNAAVMTRLELIVRRHEDHLLKGK